MVFKTVEPHQGFTLGNQEHEITDFRDIDIEEHLADMFVTPDQFVVLTAPKAQYKVRYVQASAVNSISRPITITNNR